MSNIEKQNNSIQEDDDIQITDLEPEQSPRKRSARWGNMLMQNIFMNAWIRNSLFSLLLLFFISVLFWQVVPWQQNRPTVLAPTPDLSEFFFRYPPNVATMNHRFFIQDLNRTLGAYQVETGQVLWSTRLAGSAALQASDQVIYVYFHLKSGTGRLEALQATDGQLLWQRDLPLASSVANIQLSNNVLYANGTTGAIYAVQANNGHLNWSYTPNNASSPDNNLLQIQNGILEILLEKNTVVLLNAQTGRAIMEVPDGISSQLQIEGTLLYILPPSGNSSGNTNIEVFQLDQGGKRLWSRTLTTNEVPLLEQNHVIYLGRADGSQLDALSESNGQTLWTYQPPVGDAIIDHELALTGSRLSFLTVHNTLIGLNASNGQIAWQTRMPDLTTNPGGSVYIYTQQNLLFIARAQSPGESPETIYTLRASDGQRLWQITTVGNMSLDSIPLLTIQDNGHIDAWNRNTGLHLWSHQGRAQPYVYETLEYKTPLLLLSSAEGGIVVLRLSDGKQLWGSHSS